MRAEWKDIKREQFDKLADKIWMDDVTQAPVNIYYNGSGIRGSMCIEVDSDLNAYNKALQMAMEIITE